MFSGEFQQSYRFTVLIGPMKIGFSRVSGLKCAAALEPLNEGGADAPHMVRARPKLSEPLTFEMGASTGVNRLLQFTVGLPLILPMTVVTMTENWGIGRTFTVDDPIVESWQLSDLDAMNGEVLIEKFSVLHSGIYGG